MKQRDEHDVGYKVHNPRPIVLVCDATFYGKKKDKLGTLVFRDVLTNESIVWKHIDSEKSKDYKYLLGQVLDLGYEILAVVTDGKRGLSSVFKDCPTQMCIFHQKRITQRYLTLNPKTEAGKELRKITSKLKQTNEKNFTKSLDIFYDRYKGFIEVKTFNDESGKFSYTHSRVRSAYRSLRANLPYLFTYKNYKQFNIPNTTNNLEGGVFSHLKILIKIHRGLSKSLKLKIVDDYLMNYKKK